MGGNVSGAGPEGVLGLGYGGVGSVVCWCCRWDWYMCWGVAEGVVGFGAAMYNRPTSMFL